MPTKQIKAQESSSRGARSDDPKVANNEGKRTDFGIVGEPPPDIPSWQKAQIYAALSSTRYVDKSEPLHNCKTTTEVSKAKRLGKALKRLFMNEQLPRATTSNRKDSWDELYRTKDLGKIRPVHEEFGVL